MGKNKKPAPLIFVEIERQYKSIYSIKRICGLDVISEPPKTKKEVIQCHRCQLFGHKQKNCHADYRCMKCAGNHSTHLCDKPKTTSAKCANCNGEHVATAWICTKNPNNKTNTDIRPSTSKTVSTENPWFQSQQTQQLRANLQEN